MSKAEKYFFFSSVLIIKSNARSEVKLEREGKVRFEQCHAYDAKTKKEEKKERKKTMASSYFDKCSRKYVLATGEC